MKLFAVIVFFGILVPAGATAEPSSADRATARALGLDAEAALAAKDYATAADLYARADALFHAPTLLLGLARAQVGLGKLVDAQETYQRIVTEAVPASAPPVFAEAVASAEKELATVMPRIAWLTITVTGAPSPTVRLDDAVVPPAALGVRRAVDPGTHTIVAQGGTGPAVKTASVTLSDGKTDGIVLDLTPQGIPLGTEAASAAREKPPWRPQRTLAYVLFGAGGASAVVGAIFAGMTASSYAAFNSNPTQAGADQTVRDARIADGTLISAGVLGAAGLVLWLVAKGPESPKAPRGALAQRLFAKPPLGTRDGALAAGFRF
jgi:hypothetical protein